MTPKPALILRHLAGDGIAHLATRLQRQGLPDAVALSGSAACAHQTSAIGMHLAVQFQVEIDKEKITRCVDAGFARAVARSSSAIGR